MITIDHQLPPRIREKIVMRDAPADRQVIGPCWIWIAGKSTGGYGLTRWFDGKLRYLHRIAYTVYVGEIPAGLQLDHLCRVRSCCSPLHLEPVTLRVNILRGEKATKTECVNGHPLSGDNLVWNKEAGRFSHRRCRTCSYESHLGSVERHGEKWKAARRAKYLEEHPPSTGCRSGHEWSESNTRISPSTGHRICRQCERDRKRRWRDGTTKSQELAA